MLTDDCKGISVTSQVFTVYTLLCCVDGCAAETTIRVNDAYTYEVAAMMRFAAKEIGWGAWIPPEWMDCGEHLCVCPEHLR